MELIKTLFPGWALKRETARHQIEVLKRYYDAAQGSNQRNRPRTAASPQLNTQQGSVILRDFARNLDENHDIAIGILDTLVNNIVGSSIPITPTVKDNKGELLVSVNEQMSRLLSDWKRRPEASRTLPFDEMCRLVCRTWLRDGEGLAQRIKGLTPALKHHSVIPYSLELIEADFLPFDMESRTNPVIVQGVEVNAWSQPIAYHLLKSAPNEYFKLRVRARDTKRVEAAKMFHMKFIRRFNQIRGVSILHGAITRLDDLKEYEESERIAARVAAAMTGFIKKSPETNRAVDVDGEENREYQMQPGMIYTDLLPGEEIGTISSDRPNTNLGSFRNDMLRAAAAGTGTNYSSIAKNYDGSYSSQRQSMVESIPAYDRLFSYFAEIFVRPMYDDFIDMALLIGAVNIPQGTNRETLHDVDIRGVAMPWIDPKKEVEADVIAVDNGFKSRHQTIRERGGDPAQVDKENTNDTFEATKPEPANTSEEDLENA